jgi:hypothetical protein
MSHVRDGGNFRYVAFVDEQVHRAKFITGLLDDLTTVRLALRSPGQ